MQPTVLFARNVDVDAINASHLAALKGDSLMYAHCVLCVLCGLTHSKGSPSSPSLGAQCVQRPQPPA